MEIILLLILVAIVSKGGRDLVRGLVTLVFGLVLLTASCAII